MDEYTPIKITFDMDEYAQVIRTYKVDSRQGRWWIELIRNGQMCAMITVDNQSIGKWLGDMWARTGVFDWDGHLFDDNIGLIIF